MGTENELPCELDIRCGEDQSRTEERPAAGNAGVLRKRARTLRKRNPRNRRSARQRQAAALDTEFLEESLAGTTNVAKGGGVRPGALPILW